MEIKTINGIDYYIDNNNNKWNTNKWTKSEAIALSKSLIDCENCLDCYDCENCDDCKYCNNCKDCRYCINCVNCINCGKCNGCNDCNRCSRCKGCINCKNCRNCRACNDCNACENCANCENCDDCNGYVNKKNYNFIDENREPYDEVEYQIEFKDNATTETHDDFKTTLDNLNNNLVSNQHAITLAISELQEAINKLDSKIQKLQENINNEIRKD